MKTIFATSAAILAFSTVNIEAVRLSVRDWKSAALDQAWDGMSGAAGGADPIKGPEFSKLSGFSNWK